MVVETDNPRIPNITYSDFINMPQGFEDVGGPWRANFDKWPNNTLPNAGSTYSSVNGGVTRMIVVSQTVDPPATVGAVVYFGARIVIEPKDYPDGVDYSLSFTPLYAQIRASQSINYLFFGVLLSKTSFGIQIPYSSYATPLPNPQPDTRIVRKGTYLWDTANNELLVKFRFSVFGTSGFQLYLEDVEFRVTNGPLASLSPTATQLPPSSSSSSSTPLRLPAGAIAGIAVSAVVVVVASLLCFLLYRRRRQQGQEQPQPESSPPIKDEFKDVEAAGTTPWAVPYYPKPKSEPTSEEKEDQAKLPTPAVLDSAVSPNPTVASSQTMLAAPIIPARLGISEPAPAAQPSSTPPGGMKAVPAITRGPKEAAPAPSGSTTLQTSAALASMTLPSHNSEPSEAPPPLYGSNPGLAAWARAHRDYVTEDLEAKLANASYLPVDDPDLLSKEEWAQRHGVSTFELARLRRLYASRND